PTWLSSELQEFSQFCFPVSRLQVQAAMFNISHRYLISEHRSSYILNTFPTEKTSRPHPDFFLFS
ncbi:mCG1031675, isoform CRA_b, partial [Mus musculus]